MTGGSLETLRLADRYRHTGSLYADGKRCAPRGITQDRLRLPAFSIYFETNNRGNKRAAEGILRQLSAQADMFRSRSGSGGMGSAFRIN